MIKTILTATVLTLVALPSPSRAMDDDGRARIRALQDRWEAEDQASKIDRRLRALEDDAAETRQERTGPIYLNNGSCIWNFGNCIYGKC